MHVLFANNFCYLRGGAESVLFVEMELLGRKATGRRSSHKIIPRRSSPTRSTLRRITTSSPRGLRGSAGRPRSTIGRPAALARMLREKRPDWSTPTTSTAD